MHTKFIVKADGLTEEFDKRKLLHSLERAGATVERAQQITTEIEAEIYDGISTGEIYRQAFSYLNNHRRVAAARYSLKRAILDFGPTGFPFEAYLAELFRAEGYVADIDQIVQGKCVEHEIDVVLVEDNRKIYVEAKFHNSAGFKTDLQTILYVKARLQDIDEKNSSRNNMGGLLVTNTKFTSKAIQYALCAGIELLAWEYPKNNNLHDRIDKARVYPITALTSLSHHDKELLINEKIVLCNNLIEKKDALEYMGISKDKINVVISEAAGLCLPGGDS